MTALRSLLWVLAGSLAGATSLPAQAAITAAPAGICRQEPTEARGPSRDLYCIDLVPAPDFPAASGTAELGRVPSPFGVAVTAEGHHLYDVTVSVDGLPDPASLGPYTTFIAWATTPLLRPMVRLGEVGNGQPVTGQVGFNKFLIFVSAEASAHVEDRGGRLVLRGTSPSMRMQPHKAPFLLIEAAGSSGAGHDGQQHAHGTHEMGEDGWIPPPMHPHVAMPPGLMGLRPNATPFRPGANAAGAIPEARPNRVVRLRDGDTLNLEAGLVRRTINGQGLILYGFNGQYPGPLIRVDQGATIVVNFTNRTEFPNAVHWHGIRLDNRFDGVPHLTQQPVQTGGTFRYLVRFPDAGIYWYHPHHREDVLQNLGLYGNIRVDSPLEDFFAPVNREESLMLDDLLLAKDGLVPHGQETPTHALMGRFGNVLLVNGEPSYRLEVKRGEVVRFFLTNVANTRTFNISFGGAPIKLVGSDIGKFEREAWVESVVIAPAERYIVDVHFDRAGEFALANQVQGINHLYGNFFSEVDTLGLVRAVEQRARPDRSTAFRQLRENAAVSAEIDRYRRYFDKSADHELVLSLKVDGLPFPLEPLMRMDSAYFHPVEWSGTMTDMDWLATGKEVRWILRDPATGKENHDIDWRFRQGDVIKLRISNNRHVLHAMQHTIHLHGQRFLVLSQNGVTNDNLVWKDTFLVPVGTTADVLVEMSNTGLWMLHCHIAEHLEAGMHMVFVVEP